MTILALNVQGIMRVDDFPHPAVKCIVDNHRSLDILGDLRICLDGLYKKCPKNKED